MIITSKRCFINVLAQYMTLDVLLNANYYIADAKAPNSGLMFDSNMRFNEDGQLVVENAPTQPTISKALSKYNVRYGRGELDPSTFMTTLLTNGGDMQDPRESFVRSLYNTETIAEVYEFLYGEAPRGNSLRIMIYNDDDSVREFVYLVCEYLAKNFGEDITFIDPQYRPNIIGKAEYKGDKAYAEKTIHDLQDYILLKNFNMAITQLGYDENMNNLSVWLSCFTPEQLMHLYELVFPNDPLPPGNYTTDHIKQIITGRVSDGLPRQQMAFPNLYTSNAYLESLQAELDALG